MAEKRSKKAAVVEEKKFAVLTHSLVPKHEIVDEPEKAKLLKMFNITETQLPKILSADPVVKEIGAKIGDVIKVTRKSPTAGTSVYYRYVVGGSFE